MQVENVLYIILIFWVSTFLHENALFVLFVEEVSEEEQSEEEEDGRENGNHIPAGEGGLTNPDTMWLISVFAVYGLLILSPGWCAGQ